MVNQREGEKVLLQDPAKDPNLGKGTLTLTDQRLIFDRKKALPLSLPLKMISSVSVDRGRLVVEGREYETSALTIVRFEVKDPEKWLSLIKERK